MENFTKREKQRHERRLQILDCSLDMIISRGFDAMKIRDIADRLQISTGLFFNYFESKEQVYEELVKIGLSGPASVLKMNTGGIEPLALFEGMTSAIFYALKSDPFNGKMFLLMTHAMHNEAAPEGVKKLLAGFDFITPLVEKVREGQTKGQIRPGDPKALILAYWGAVQGIAEFSAIYSFMPMPEPGWIVDILRAR